MSTTETVKRPLSDAELLAVQEAIEAAETPLDALLAALKGTFNALLADRGETWDDYSAERPLDGSLFLIPEGQWCQIGEWLQERSRALAEDDISRVNLALSWMNSGPSGYQDAGDGSA